MKNLPACTTCVKSGFLCTSCQEKLDTGILSEFELDLAKFLLELEDDDKFNYLKTVSFYKAIDFEDVVIIEVGRKDRLKISKELIEMIKDAYEIDQIILIEKTTKPRPVIEALIAPNKLMSLNEIFLATGDIEFKAVLSKRDLEQLLFTREELEELVLEMTGNVTRVVFE